MSNRISNKGLSLIEVMIATSVFLIGLGAMLTSAVALFINTTNSSDFLTATNLARESVEIIRNQRDDNFLAENTWNAGFDYTWAIVKLDLDGGFHGVFAIEGVAYTMDECLTVNHECQIAFDPVSGLYGDTGIARPGLMPNAVNTKFHRMVQLVPINCNMAMASEDLCSLDDQIGVTIRSMVDWYRSEKRRNVTIETDLYNWL